MDNDELSGLIARCALRDQRALEQLYDKTGAYLNAVAYRIVGSSEQSNEVLQDAFVQIWDNAVDYAPSQAKALTWMTSIVRYRAIDTVRREKRHQNRPGGDEELEILMQTPGGEEPEEQCLNLSFSDDLEHCLSSMNENFNRSIKLAYFYGYTREELAAMMGTNLNTVKSWLRRGSKKLRECLEGTYD